MMDYNEAFRILKETTATAPEELDFIQPKKTVGKLICVDVLDKIRAEIKALSNTNPSYWHSGDMVNRDDVIDIIDKYKEEGLHER